MADEFSLYVAELISEACLDPCLPTTLPSSSTGAAKQIKDILKPAKQKLELKQQSHIPVKAPTAVINSKPLGALSTNLSSSSAPFLLTTAIAYTNGFPHIGHAYEFVSSDILVRCNRLIGKKVFFLTGADEHGQKVANSAAKEGRTPIDHCDIFVAAFKELNRQLAVSYDRYIRTTDTDHEQTCKDIFQICHDKGDIYLGVYEGWYNEREETFVPDNEAAANNFKDPGNGADLKKVSEESYFFRLSKYYEPLMEFIDSNPAFIEPEQARKEILGRLKSYKALEGLKDLSISRTTFTWGIKLPEGFKEDHVMYVWFDALTNYLSGVHGLDPSHELNTFWPAAVHIIGKDITWFHCVYWPCMLMSAGVSLPGKVFAHGFVNAADGRKMSKSFGNSVDPKDILDKYPLDSIRYYLCAATSYGQDINFSEAALISMHNSELADVLGNLVHRIFTLAIKYCNGRVPDASHDVHFPPPFSVQALVEETENNLKSCSIHVILFKAMEAVRATNKFITEAEPWKMKGENEYRRPSVVRTTLEAVYVFTHFLAPVIPISAQIIFDRLSTEARDVHLLREDFYNLSPGSEITVGEILFGKIEIE